MEINPLFVYYVQVSSEYKTTIDDFLKRNSNHIAIVRSYPTLEEPFVAIHEHFTDHISSSNYYFHVIFSCLIGFIPFNM